MKSGCFVEMLLSTSGLSLSTMNFSDTRTSEDCGWVQITLRLLELEAVIDCDCGSFV